MHNMDKSFTFFLTYKKDNDAAVLKYIENQGYSNLKKVLYKLEYTPPYNNFHSINEFISLTQYKPFQDSLIKKAIAIVDLSEWIGHEEDEYLEIFLKFLYDYNWSFYDYEYIFLVGNANKEKIKKLYNKADEYLYKGNLYEDLTLVDEKCLNNYLSLNYPINQKLAKKLSSIFLNKINGYIQLHMIMDDIINQVTHRKDERISEKHLMDVLMKEEKMKLLNLFEEEIQEWKNEYIDIKTGGKKDERNI